MIALHCRQLVLFAGLVLAGCMAAGCDTSFEPYAEPDRFFSVFGVLDPSDVRHYVRVEALQDDKPFDADTTLDATVTLTRQATGRTVTLVNEPFSSQGIKHNFRTDAMDLRLDEAYRLAVQRPDDETATTATFTTPHEVPELTLSELGLRATIEGGTEDRLLFLTVYYHTTVDPKDPTQPGYDRTFVVRHKGRARRTETGYAASFDWRADVDSLHTSGQEATVYLNEVEVQVGLVHPSAPSYEGLTYGELFRPGVAPSNVENGAGFVAGLTTDRGVVDIPFDQQPRTTVP